MSVHDLAAPNVLKIDALESDRPGGLENAVLGNALEIHGGKHPRSASRVTKSNRGVVVHWSVAPLLATADGVEFAECCTAVGQSSH